MKTVMTKCCHVLFLAAFVGLGCDQSFAADSSSAASRPGEQAEEWPDLTKEYEQLNKQPPRTPQERERVAYIQNELMLRSVAAEHGDFRITGKVVDEDGNSLQDVTLVIERTKPPSLSDVKKSPVTEAENKKYTQTETVIINGKFDVKAEDFSRLCLIFTKKDYDKQQRSYRASGLSLDQAKGLLRKNATAPKSRTVKDEVTIMLEKSFVLEKEAKLKDGGCEFHHYSDGSVVLLDLKKKYGGSQPIVQNRVKELPDANKLPPNQIWVTALVDESKGVFKTVPITLDDRRFPCVAGQSLHISGKGAGFILYQPKRLEHAFREMSEAPKDGYTNELVLTSEIAFRNHAIGGYSHNMIYFYFRTADGKYGKGDFDGNWETHENTKELRLGCCLRIQPDGTRNLQTRE